MAVARLCYRLASPAGLTHTVAASVASGPLSSSLLHYQQVIDKGKLVIIVVFVGHELHCLLYCDRPLLAKKCNVDPRAIEAARPITQSNTSGRLLRR